MIQASEIILLLFGFGGLIFVLMNKSGIRQLPALTRFLYGFYCLLMAWTFTVAEEFFWPGALHILEHIAYLASAVFFLLWCLQHLRQRGKG